MEPKRSSDPDVLGGWRINGRLGEGGFGTVYLAEKGAQKAAIKVIKEEYVSENDARNRLTTEAEVLSKLSDPFVGKILDSDLSGELPWIATEFINGPTLEDKIRFEGPLDEITWFNLASNIFHAIVSANDLSIIHKDIKPSNIILGESGNKLIDFGIAHVSGQTRTMSFGEREGSILYSSPEHFTPRANPKMDVFSAASTLAYAGKGEGVWQGENDLQLMRSINEDDPDLSGLTEAQKRFLKPLFEKSPSDRPSATEAYQSALSNIEFLLGSGIKPKRLKGRSLIKQIGHSKSRLIFAGITLILAYPLIKPLVATDWSGADQSANNQISTSNSPAPNQTSNTQSSQLDNIESTVTPTPTATLNTRQTNIQLEQCLNLTQSDYKAALKNCLKVAAQQNGMANYQVGYIYDEYFKDSEKAKPFFENAISLGYVDGYVGLASGLIDKGKYQDAISLLMQAEKGGSKNSSNLLGYSYEKLGKYNLALKYYLISSKNGEILSTYNAAMIYLSKNQFDDAIKYFMIAANKNDAPSMYRLGEIYREQKRDTLTSCTWFKRGSDSGDSRAQTAWKNFCSDDFKVSAKESDNVKYYQLETRPFLGDSLFYFIWVGATGKMLDFTGIQVRGRGRTDAPWIQVPHKLQKRADVTYALVDEIFLNIATNQTNICWDFRTVREENGKLVAIWDYPTSSSCG
jgi:serine/threonine protein kinase